MYLFIFIYGVKFFRNILYIYSFLDHAPQHSQDIIQSKRLNSFSMYIMSTYMGNIIHFLVNIYIP